MGMTDWAENEVKIACERERAASGNKDGWNYGCACYESALKAFKSLMGDGHSGFSIGLTKQILNRLIDGKPLTPSEDIPENWGEGKNGGEGKITFQCKRISALFKDVYEDGKIEYHDVNRVSCININHPTYEYHSSLVSRLMHEMFPIKLPYSGEEYTVYCEDFLVDRKNGDFDTYGIFYAIKPDGERVELNKFYKEAERDWEEISAEEYQERKANRINREE